MGGGVILDLLYAWHKTAVGNGLSRHKGGIKRPRYSTVPWPSSFTGLRGKDKDKFLFLSGLIVVVWGYGYFSAVYGSVLGYIFLVGGSLPPAFNQNDKACFVFRTPPQRGHPATPRQLGGILGYKGNVCMGWDCWFDCGGMKMWDIWRGLKKSLGTFCWSSANLFYPRGESLPRLIINRERRAPRQNSGGGLRRNLLCALKGHYWRRARWV